MLAKVALMLAGMAAAGEAFMLPSSCSSSLALRSASTPRLNTCLSSSARNNVRQGTTALSMASDWYTVEKLEEGEGNAAKYKFTVTVDGQMSKDSYTAIMKDFKKNAQFPGFRKGSIPPFMIPKVKQFVILECLEKSLGEAVREQALELADENNKPNLDDAQVAELTKTFNENNGFKYTIEALLKPSTAEEAKSA
ncbi:hypothetical protein GUITHDRAFT_106412 [Guillardia theta CCMP2712]|uniref:Trigger factor ribosome-binding bacterial domain-containing protein n=2 Tax=Guillardia theta TaxID=55529 RepID=L1JH75_GUITC|nr:hypothetical protein GUITHDRAFT_106412 [Guillardia theta CCMP2712]EKX47863.1 hypothetical protein GUITHDRAFT_106412 [Guillardia theta CCMP2712]|eukprot:XP_005834843.1 hypothetical protein GUITHDRAFT_106412 [Guillardia theta CCMP2712]